MWGKIQLGQQLYLPVKKNTLIKVIIDVFNDHLHPQQGLPILHPGFVCLSFTLAYD